jgi:2-hydroxy-3-keto-5-methylthiopentenyl-1-phosphate phosphatase
VLTNHVDWATGRLEFPHEDRCCPCSTCGVCKQAPIKEARHAGRTAVLVGDGTSDRKAALLADLVFAKGRLAQWCAREEVPHRRFGTLADVQAALLP